MDSIISSEVDFKGAVAGRDIYRYTRLTPNLNSGDFALTASSNPEISFEIPTKVLNLSRSYLAFKMNMSATDLAGLALNVKGASMLQRVTLETRSGITLADIPNVDVYTKSVLPAVTKRCDIEEAPMAHYGGAIGDAVASTLPLSMAYESRAFDAEVFAAPYANVLPSDDCEFIYSTGTAEGGFTTGITNGVANRLRARDAGGAHMNVAFRIPLSSFAHTVMSVDKSLVFPEVIILKLIFNNYSVFMANVTNVGAISTVNGIAGLSVNISSAHMMLAVSKDASVTDRLVSRLSTSGIQMTVPYVHSAVNMLSSIEQSVNLRYNSGFGKRLLNIYNVVQGPTAFRYWSANNLTSALVSKYYTTVDSVRIQESDLNSNRQEDYMYHKDILQGSVIEAPLMYAANRLEIDSFRAGKTVDWLMSDTVNDGLSLDSNELTYTVFHTVPDDATLTRVRYTYTFAVVQKEMSLSSQGISIQ